MTSSADSDWDLVGRASEPGALGELFTRHRDFVFRIALGRLGQVSDAEEATQEVFYQIARRGKPWYRRGKFTTWLYQVTSNAVKDRIRREKKHQNPQPGPTMEVASQELNYRLREALSLISRLPTRQREVVTLRLLEGFSERETAATLRISTGSVKTHLHRAIKHLKSKLTEPTEEQPCVS